MLKNFYQFKKKIMINYIVNIIKRKNQYLGMVGAIRQGFKRGI